MAKQWGFYDFLELGSHKTHISCFGNVLVQFHFITPFGVFSPCCLTFTKQCGLFVIIWSAVQLTCLLNVVKCLLLGVFSLDIVFEFLGKIELEEKENILLHNFLLKIVVKCIYMLSGPRAFMLKTSKCVCPSLLGEWLDL